MLLAYVSDEYYAALADVQVELRGGPEARHLCVRSWPSGAVHADIPPGVYEVCLARPGFGVASIWYV